MSLQITLLRHSIVEPEERDHQKWSLSRDGKSLAQERRARLGRPSFDLVIHSGLAMAEETARIVAGIDETAPTIVVASLFGNIEDDLEYLAKMASVHLAREIGERASSNVLVVGHAGLLPSICAELIHDANSFLDRDVGACQGWHITISDGRLGIQFIS